VTRQTHRGFAVFIGLNALAAWGGAIALMTGVIDMGDLTDRLPFASPVLGGVALALVVAIPLSFLSYAAWTGALVTPSAAEVSGVLLLGWITVQAAMLRAFSPFQPFYLAVGAALIVWGQRQHRRTSTLS
jgi:hypothetical protein